MFDSLTGSLWGSSNGSSGPGLQPAGRSPAAHKSLPARATGCPQTLPAPNSMPARRPSPTENATSNPGGDFGNLLGSIGSAFKRVDNAFSWAAQVESMEETDVCEKLGRTQFPEPRAQAQSPPQLQGGGELDELLQPGQTRRLLTTLPERFKKEPPSGPGKNSQGCGQSHGFHGTYGRKVFSPLAVAKLVEQARGFWEAEPNITKLMVAPDARLLVIGDTHGQLEDVFWMFFKYGPPSSKNVYLFDGDIVDRGGHALEILLIIFALKRDCPSSVHVLRGNHEDEPTSSTFGFKVELETKFGADGAGGWIFYMLTHKVFPLLPIAAHVSDANGDFNVCVLHGGIPVRAPGQTGPLRLNELNRLERKVVSVQRGRETDTLQDHLLFNLLWADPEKPGQSSSKGRGNGFSEQDTTEFCRVNQLRCIIRAHQPPEDNRGTNRCHGNRCYTVFSASNYCGILGNKGGVLICDGITFSQTGPQPGEHWAPQWEQLANIFMQHSIFDMSQAQRLHIAQGVESGEEPLASPKSAQLALASV